MVLNSTPGNSSPNCYCTYVYKRVAEFLKFKASKQTLVLVHERAFLGSLFHLFKFLSSFQETI